MNNEEKKVNEVNVLDELNKGACMGKDAIHFILDKVEDDALKDELNKQYEKYQEICEKIKNIYPEYTKDDDEEPHKPGAMNKAMTWYNIEMHTFLNDGTSKIAELLLQGTNMGIIEGRRLLNNKDVTPEIHALLQEYVDMQEDAVEKLKQFL